MEGNKEVEHTDLGDTAERRELGNGLECSFHKPKDFGRHWTAMKALGEEE